MKAKVYNTKNSSKQTVIKD